VHSHPSIRLGVVARGEGRAFGPMLGGGTWEQPLRPGAMFLLHPHEMHAFRTSESGQSMDVIAYHPDSDWGPTDAIHPMLNRTYRGF
jgi:AraC-like ligand binding domain